MTLRAKKLLEERKKEKGRKEGGRKEGLGVIYFPCTGRC